MRRARTAKPPTAPPAMAPMLVELELDCGAAVGVVVAGVLDGEEVCVAALTEELDTSLPPSTKLLLYACRYGIASLPVFSLAPANAPAGQLPSAHGLSLQQPQNVGVVPLQLQACASLLLQSSSGMRPCWEASIAVAFRFPAGQPVLPHGLTVQHPTKRLPSPQA